MNHITAMNEEADLTLDVVIVTLDEIAVRENAVNQVACCIWNYN